MQIKKIVPKTELLAAVPLPPACALKQTIEKIENQKDNDRQNYKKNLLHKYFIGNIVINFCFIYRSFRSKIFVVNLASFHMVITFDITY